MPETKRPLKVFLCHASEDKRNVRAIYRRLIDGKIDAWLDEEKLLPGQDFDFEIRKAIRASDVIVVVLSEKSVAKEGYVQKEIRRALDVAEEKPDGTIFVIPARLDGCDVPERLKHWQWVNLYESGSYEKLIKALENRAEQIGALLPYKNRKAVRSSWSPFLWFSKLRIEYKTLIIASIVTIFAAIFQVLFAKYLESSSVLTTTPTKSVTTAVATLPSPITTTQPPTQTQIPPSTPTPVVFNPHPESSDYIDSFGVPMRLVPEGEYDIGSSINADEPKRKVNLTSFYIDLYEVTNSLYQQCVDASGCDNPPTQIYSSTRAAYYGNSDYENYPVIYVTWEMANKYCTWRGADLPSEIQWEVAARDNSDLLYPWGNTPSCSNANFRNTTVNCNKDTTRVGSYDINGYAYDMIGNVAEWVKDFYDSNFYNTFPDDAPNPINLNPSAYKSVRGGSWNSSSFSYGRVSFRAFFEIRAPGNDVDTAKNVIGFRCARTP